MLWPVSALLAVGVACAAYLALLAPPPALPRVDPRRWWGAQLPPAQLSTAVRPYRVHFNSTMIQDLRRRLENRRPFTKPLEGVQSEYGINTVFLDKVLDYWRTEYAFEQRADLLNQFPHFITNIQGLDIHFVHAKPEKSDKEVLPILLLHGWPSSSKEFQYVIPLLTAPRGDRQFVFEVVAADLPGFGFSQGTSKQGLNSIEMAAVMRNLMHRLGFPKFYIHAGDWGSHVSAHLATLFPEDVLGYHLTMAMSTSPMSVAKILLGSLYPPLLVDPQYANRLYPLRDLFAYILREFGYFHLQATKPDTIGVALGDSPSALAGYVMEKMAMCTHRDRLHRADGGLLDAISLDDILDTVSIMWSAGCATTAARMYATSTASVRTPELRTMWRIPTPVPTAALNARYEVFYNPDSVLRDKYPNLLHSTTLDHGGHFLALELPGELADDIYRATQAFRAYHAKLKA